MSESASIELRRLHYRLMRQGMLELDAWLAGLKPALDSGDFRVRRSIGRLLAMEPPQLLAVMQGGAPLPDELRPWLDMQPKGTRLAGCA
jgi:succinate dehydrogenase flavin-adding protein (antitoxin of CptAB toxin-antitoxin module)